MPLSEHPDLIDSANGIYDPRGTQKVPAKRPANQGTYTISARNDRGAYVHPDIGNTDLRQPLTTDKGEHPDSAEWDTLDAIVELESDAVKQAAAKAKQPTGAIELRDLLDEHGRPDMARVAAWQARQPWAVQSKVADRDFPTFAAYFQEVDRLNRELGAVSVTDEDVAAMSLEQYDRLFTAEGRPKQGVIYRPTRQVPIRKGGQ